MRLNLLTVIIIQFLADYPVACAPAAPHPQEHYEKIADIPLPPGYQLLPAPSHSFAAWLQQLRLKKDPLVHLYNGRLKEDQSVQFAVLDVPVGSQDLQQCADAVMRLRASWLYDEKRWAEISFADNNGKRYQCPANINPAAFEKYLQQVYIHCGTLSLSKQLHSINISDIQPGDVFVHGGSPGHAMIVMEVARNAAGKTIFILAQSYMPAQEMHIVKNFKNIGGNPWYSTDSDNQLIITPEWTFTTSELSRW